MSFSSSALLVSWLAIALLALGFAGLARQVAALSRRGGSSGAAVRTTSDLIGLALPTSGDLARLRHPGRLLVLFVSPGCPSCHALIGDIATLGLDQRVTVVSSGTCSGVESAPSIVCIAQARDILDRLAVPATPYLMSLDSEGTITATRVPTELSDLRTFAESALGSGALTPLEERS
jgi:hypothetical protein